MSDFFISHPKGFAFGYTPITKIGETVHDTGINFGILKLKAGDTTHLKNELESAYLLIQGQCILSHNNTSITVERLSCFDENPYALHLPAHHFATICALSDCEFAVSQVYNPIDFGATIYDQTNMLEAEPRGKGILNDTAFRIVRTIFDSRNSPQSKLVLGEVITAPGCWSSYPPHHHPHPEIYHYRFTEPQGYGHAECGDSVFKVKQFDTYKIVNQHDHAQTAAPGYGMYYIWVIRHLDNHPYLTPEFTEEHCWTKSKSANTRVWQGFTKETL